ncbi:MAG: hypothetical protein ABIL13_05560 [candidate division WOR-3 bacterium]
MKKFFINFFILSTIGLLFFRPLFFKKEIKIENINQIDSVYYYHGFPISSLVKDKPSSNEKIKNYKVVIYPIKPEILIGTIESDVDFINLRTFNLPHGWEKIDGSKFPVEWLLKILWKLYLWVKFSDINKSNPIEFNIKARDYIKILVGSNINGGTFKVKIDTIERIVDTYDTTISIYPKWHYINLNNIISISPESKEVILKLKDKVSNLEIKGYEYELIDSSKVLIKNLKVDYFKVFLNSLFVIIYAFLLSIILTFSNSLFLRYFSIVFTIPFIYFLAYFPGIYTPDSIYQTSQAIGLEKFNDCHPPFHTLTIKIVLSIFHHIGFYILIQIIFASILFAWILSKLKLKNLELYLILTFSFPLTGLMLIVLWKDIPFSLSLIWLSFLLYFAYNDKNYLKNNLNLIAFIISLSFVMLFRYNGIPVVIITLIIMLFLFKAHIKKVFLILLSLILIYSFSEILFYKILKVERSVCKYQKDFFILGEYVVSNFPFEPKDKKIIEEVKKFEDIKKSYNCYSIVPLLWDGKLNFEKFEEYRKEIRKILFKTIYSDIKPFLNHLTCSSSYIWYYVASYNLYIIEFTMGEIPKAKLVTNLKLPQIKEITEKIMYRMKKLASIIFKPFIYTYILLFTFILSPTLRILTIPSLLNVLILIVISPSSEFRYNLPSYLLSLIFLLIFVSKIRNKPLKFSKL